MCVSMYSGPAVPARARRVAMVGSSGGAQPPPGGPPIMAKGGGDGSEGEGEEDDSEEVNPPAQTGAPSTGQKRRARAARARAAKGKAPGKPRGRKYRKVSAMLRARAQEVGRANICMAERLAHPIGMLQLSCSMVCIGRFGSGCVNVPFPKVDTIMQQAPPLGPEQLQELTLQAGGGGQNRLSPSIASAAHW